MLLHRGARLFLFPHQADDFRWWSDELQSAGLADLGKGRVFGKQAITGMDGIRICDLGRADHGWNIEIAQSQLWRPNADGFIGKTDGQRIPVRLTVNRNRADAQFLAGTDNAQGDLPAIGNQDLLKHAFSNVAPASRRLSNGRPARSR